MPADLAWSAICFTFVWNKSRSTIIEGVGRTSLVMSRKSRRAIRESNSSYGKGVPLVLAAHTRATENALAAAPATRKSRRDLMDTLLGGISYTLVHPGFLCKPGAGCTKIAPREISVTDFRKKAI